jgi:Asp/Glu/hydantoin racemase
MPAQTHFLLINPNSSAHITQRLLASARTALESGDTLQAVTASGEPLVVRDAATLQQAEHNAVALFDAHADACAAVLLGISLDGAAPLLRLRRPALPVVGMTEAALMCACLRAQRVGLLTLGPALVWAPDGAAAPQFSFNSWKRSASNRPAKLGLQSANPRLSLSPQRLQRSDQSAQHANATRTDIGSRWVGCLWRRGGTSRGG